MEASLRAWTLSSQRPRQDSFPSQQVPLWEDGAGGGGGPTRATLRFSPHSAP